jgi:hypothetical protein
VVLQAVTAFNGLSPAARRAAGVNATIGGQSDGTVGRYVSLYAKHVKPWCVSEGMSDFPLTEAKVGAFIAARAALPSKKGSPDGLGSMIRALTYAG